MPNVAIIRETPQASTKDIAIQKNKIAQKESTMVGLSGQSLINAQVQLEAENDKLAVLESRKLNIPVIAIVDTNANPDLIDLVCVSCFLSLLFCSLLLNNSIFNYSAENYFWLLMLGVIPTLIGHTIFSYSIKFVSPTIIASIPLGEPIIASILAFVLFSEGVASNVFIGGIIIAIGLIFLIRSNN